MQVDARLPAPLWKQEPTAAPCHRSGRRACTRRQRTRAEPTPPTHWHGMTRRRACGGCSATSGCWRSSSSGSPTPGRCVDGRWRPAWGSPAGGLCKNEGGGSAAVDPLPGRDLSWPVHLATSCGCLASCWNLILKPNAPKYHPSILNQACPHTSDAPIRTALLTMPGC